MFGIGTYELLVIAALALMLFSPRELPKVIKSFARFWGSIRRTADEFRSAVMDDEELREPIDEIRQAYRGAKDEMRGAEEAARRELAKARMEVRRAERNLEDAVSTSIDDPEAITDPQLEERVSADATLDAPVPEPKSEAPSAVPPPPPVGSGSASHGAA